MSTAQTIGNTMSNVRTGRPVRRYLSFAVQAAVAVLGGVWGWRFGLEVGGVLIGLVAALNCAAFAALLAGAVIQWLLTALDRTGRNG
jgi:hypothetical protein